MTAKPGYLLDTHVLVWLKAAPSRLSAAQTRALRAVEARQGTLAISAITLWELAMLVTRGRLDCVCPLDEFLRGIEEDPALFVIPIEAKVAAASTTLGGNFHGDPADRLIVATALVHDLPLLTADRPIRESGVVHTI